MFDVIKALLLRELLTRFGKTRFGILYHVAEDAVNIIVMFIMFSFIRGSVLSGSNVDFWVFLITGMVPYFLFREITFAVMDGARENKALFHYKPVKPFDVYVSRTILETFIKTLMFFLFLFGIGIFMDGQILPKDMLGAIFSILLLISFAFALGLVLAVCINIKYGFRSVVQTVFKFLYFASGTMWPITAFPSNYQFMLSFNPILQIIDIFRQNFFNDYTSVPYINVYYPLSLTIILLYVGLFLYHKRRIQLAVN